MKKILPVFALTISVFLLSGCVQTVTQSVRNGTLSTLPINPEVRLLPITAELKVSEKEATGEAIGLKNQEEILIAEATAKALGQNPPSVDQPDVLVGVNWFTEETRTTVTSNSVRRRGSSTTTMIKVTVTGYPAYYTKFRTADEKDPAALPVVTPNAEYIGGPIPGWSPKPPKPHKRRF